MWFTHLNPLFITIFLNSFKLFSLPGQCLRVRRKLHQILRSLLRKKIQQAHVLRKPRRQNRAENVAHVGRAEDHKLIQTRRGHEVIQNARDKTGGSLKSSRPLSLFLFHDDPQAFRHCWRF